MVQYMYICVCVRSVGTDISKYHEPCSDDRLAECFIRSYGSTFIKLRKYLRVYGVGDFLFVHACHCVQYTVFNSRTDIRWQGLIFYPHFS